MELNSMTDALLEIVKILKRFIYFPDPSSYLTLGLSVLQTHCFRLFDVTPYFLITGPTDSGKTTALKILNFLCYRSLLVSDTSNAGFYYLVNRLHGTLILDEAEYLGQRYQHEIDMSMLLHGYELGGFVLRMDPGKRRLVKYDCYGPKFFGNISGIWSRPLKTRCITIKMVSTPPECQRERFSPILHGKQLKELLKAITQLFKRKKTQEQIKLLHREFGSVQGLINRGLQLWMGMLILSRIINLEGRINPYERLLRIALDTTRKREEEALCLDWDVKFLLSLAKYVSTLAYDGKSYLVAEEVARFIIDDVNPPFGMRTESLGRKLDNASLLKRRLIYKRDEKGNLVHKTGWMINVERLKQRVAEYERILPSAEEFEKEEKDKIFKDLKEVAWENLTEEERRKRLAEVGRPTNWGKSGKRRSLDVNNV